VCPRKRKRRGLHALDRTSNVRVLVKNVLVVIDTTVDYAPFSSRLVILSVTAYSKSGYSNIEALGSVCPRE